MLYTAENEWCAAATEAVSVSAVLASNIKTLSFIEESPNRKRSARVRDAVDDVAIVVAEKQSPVVHRRYIRGPTPRLAIRPDEADEEVFVLARRLAVLDGYAHDLVAGAIGAVPRAVEDGERVADVVRRECRAARRRRVEREADSGRVRFIRHIGRDGFAFQIGALARVPR